VGWAFLKKLFFFNPDPNREVTDALESI